MMNADPPLTVLDDTRMGKARVRLSYRHIAILLSAPSSWVETYGRIFGVLGIPIRGTGKDALDDEPIARDLLNLLAIIDNPIQDIPLAGALLSPMCGASPDTLFLMRVSIHKDAQLYDTMQNALLLGWDEFVASFKDVLKDEALLERIKSDFGLLEDFASKLGKLRSFARSHSVAELVEHAIAATSLDDIATLDLRSNGALSRLNYIRARARDAGGIELSRFLTMLTGGERIELPVGAVGESIELMSVHQAKGLEFPVVILGGLGHNFNLEDIRKNVLFDRELGFGTKVIHPKNPVRYPTAAFSVVKRRMQTRQLEEEMRKLYVATTRAQERLILVGTTRGAAIAGKYEEKRGDGAQPVLERENARCFADWIIPLALESPAFHDALSSCGVFPQTAPRGFGAHFGAECTSEVEIDEYFAEKTAKSSVVPGSEYDRIAKDEPAPYAECADTANDGSGSADAPSRAPALEIPEVVVHSYAYRDATIARAKVSATALAHMDDPDSLSVRFKRSEPYFHLPEKPLTLAERKLGVDADLDDSTPAIKRGIALHLLMERLPFGIGVKIDVISEIGKLKESGVLTDELAGMIPGYSVVRILDTPIGRRLCGKGSVKTEWRFLSRVGVDKLKESPRVLRALGITRENTGSDFDAQNDKLAIRASDGDFIVLQGVVDLIFEDGAGRIVVDWKTNNIAESEVPACAESYALQLWAYRYAVETAIGAVDDAYLAFVMPGVYAKARL
jgi:ATP-dependent helicase/nuclease subunit A